MRPVRHPLVRRLPALLVRGLPAPLVRRLHAALAALVVSAVITASAGHVAAQGGPGGDIDLQAFRPAMDSRGFITVNSSQSLGHLELSFGLVTNWGRNVLRLKSPASDASSYTVEHLVSPTLIGAMGLRVGGVALELGASLPFSIMAGDRDPDTTGAPGSPNDDASHQFEGQGLGDARVHAKWRLMSTSRGPGLGLAVIGSLALPTASAANSWIGSGALTPQITAVLDKEVGPLRLAVEGGLRYRGQTQRFVDDRMIGPNGQPQPVTNQMIEVGSSVPVGAGIAYALAPQRFDLVGEVFAELPLGGENYFPVEAVGGIKVYLAKNSFLTLGAGAGLRRASGGSPDVRAFVGIVFEPNLGDRDGDGVKDDVDGCPDDPEDFDDFEDRDGCPELDNDRDRIPDTDDACPNEPEDRDGVDDHDGCPEADQFDRDSDGVLDSDDECPDDPEDRDGWEDLDGCPDSDNDGDRVLDIDDLCPDDAEDEDGWEDQDGCPDHDNDRDRIPDVDDACPNEKEVYNTVDDEDGCPDRGKVFFDDKGLVVLETIYFEYNSAVIKRQSHAILDTVAKTMNLNPDIVLFEVQGHTDERGSDVYNLALSQARAESVIRFLGEAGVAEDRMEARGYGEQVPLDTRSNEAAWAKNRRVEFVIVKRDSD